MLSFLVSAHMITIMCIILLRSMNTKMTLDKFVSMMFKTDIYSHGSNCL